MKEVKYAHYRLDFLPAIAVFWNEEFRDRRNFFPITGSLFERRVAGGETQREHFSPDQLTLAYSQDKVVGMIHCLARSEDTCAQIFPDWRGGSQGVIAFFSVARDRRCEGIGAELFRRAAESAAGRSQIVIDGQCLCPFYGNAAAPFTPFWGTPEGPSISDSDADTVRFLKSQGFEPRYTAVTMETRLAGPEDTGTTEKHLPDDCTIEVFKERSTRGGGSSKYYRACCFRAGKTAGDLVFFEMSELAPGTGAVYNFEVAEAERGKGIGTNILKAALSEMKKMGWRTCEVLTIPYISPAGVALYEKNNFRPVARWLIY